MVRIQIRPCYSKAGGTWALMNCKCTIWPDTRTYYTASEIRRKGQDGCVFLEKIHGIYIKYQCIDAKFL